MKKPREFWVHGNINAPTRYSATSQRPKLADLYIHVREVMDEEPSIEDYQMATKAYKEVAEIYEKEVNSWKRMCEELADNLTYLRDRHFRSSSIPDCSGVDFVKILGKYESLTKGKI